MSSVEPWLRGRETDVPAVGGAVLHALRLADEDLRKWCGNLSDTEINVRSAGTAPVAFHIRHLARSLDRLLTYAEGRSLSEGQTSRLRTELDPGATRDGLFAELTAAAGGWRGAGASTGEDESGRGANRGKKVAADYRGRIARPCG